MSSFVSIIAAFVTANAYDVAYEDVTVGGYVCGGSQNSRVYYPKDAGKVPVISYAHGFTAYGVKAYNSVAPMLEALAGTGYVVTVFESSAEPKECPDEWKDQIHNLEWSKTSKFASMIDFSKKTGILGHSMGGGATYHSAGQASAVQGQNIGAAVALHPQIRGPGTTPLLPITNSLVPIFFGTGTKDTVVGPLSVQIAYYDTQNVSKAFSSIEGATHIEPCTGHPNRHTEYAIAMFDCHLQNKQSQCDKIYGKGAGSLCGGKVKMAHCEHAIPNPGDPCNYCNTGVCSGCKACLDSKTGACALCWKDTHSCLFSDKHGCQKCWSGGLEEQTMVV